jgi:hypothetical protein
LAGAGPDRLGSLTSGGDRDDRREGWAYYVVAGQVVLGSRVLNPGDGFFVPNGMPYKYQAGPDGVEILEFRAGGGVDGAPAIKLHEPSVDAINRLTAAAVEHHEDWTDPPAHVADVNRRSS